MNPKQLLESKRLEFGFVIEAEIREGSEKEKDTPRYHTHWYGGVTNFPGTGEFNSKAGKFVPAVMGAFWSPHFSDAHVFNTREAAETEIKVIIGPQIEAKVYSIIKCHYERSWS